MQPYLNFLSHPSSPPASGQADVRVSPKSMKVYQSGSSGTHIIPVFGGPGRSMRLRVVYTVRSCWKQRRRRKRKRNRRKRKRKRKGKRQKRRR